MTASAQAFLDSIVLFQKNANTDTVTRQIRESFLRKAEDYKKLPDGTDQQIIDYFLQNLQVILSSDARRVANANGSAEVESEIDLKKDSNRALTLLVRYLSNDSRALKRFNPTQKMV